LLWFLASCGAVGAVGACVAAIVGAVMQRNAAQKLEARRASDAQSLERLKADLVQKLDDERVADAQAIEHLKAQLAKLTQLSTSGEQRRAEVAAEVLVGVLRMLDALDGATSQGVFAKRVDDAPAARHQWAWLEADAREASVRPLDDEFRRAWHLAEVFLPEDVRDLFDRINKLKGEILGAHRTYALVLEQAPQHAVEVFRQGYGTEPSKKVGEVRARAKELLRPIAQLGAPRP
jgi:hypothetical protein